MTRPLDGWGMRLVDGPAYQRLRQRREALDAQDVIEAADESGVAPGLVVGGLERERAIRVGSFDHLKRRYPRDALLVAETAA